MSRTVSTPVNHADGNWHRVHPISPVVRSWLALVAIVAVIATQGGDDLYQLFIEDGGISVTGGGASIAGGVVLLVLLIIAGGFYLSWRFYQYRITAEMVQVHSGWLFRQQRHVRLDRVQAIDIKRPLLARIFGLAELSFEAADGGGSSAMTLAFVKAGDAETLRAEILRRAAGSQQPEETAAAPDTDAPESDAVADSAADPAADSSDPAVPSVAAGPSPDVSPTSSPPSPLIEKPEQVMLTVPTGRLVGSIVLSAAVTVFVILLLLAGGAFAAVQYFGDVEFSDVAPSIAVLIPIVIGAVASVWSPFSRDYGFTVATNDDGLRLRSGLLETRQQTVPPGRVQSVLISQPLLWRRFGWYRVRVSVAGYGAATDGKDVVLPVGSFDDVLRVLTVIAPDPGTAQARELIHAGAVGTGTEYGFITTPRRLRAFDPLVWRRQGFAVTAGLVLFRTGRLNRQLTLMSHERIQSANLNQGPIERTLDVTNVELHTPLGPAAMNLHHLDATVAEQLFLYETDIAAVSRRIADRNQWMLPDELAQFDRRTVEAHKTLDDESDLSEQADDSEARA